MIRKLLRRISGDGFTQSNEKYARINFGIVLIMFVVSAIMLFFLPKEISILHSGDTYYPMPSILGVWLAPIIGLVINLSFIKQKRLTPFNSVIMVIFCIFSTGYYFTLL